MATATVYVVAVLAAAAVLLAASVAAAVALASLAASAAASMMKVMLTSLAVVANVLMDLLGSLVKKINAYAHWKTPARMEENVWKIGNVDIIAFVKQVSMAKTASLRILRCQKQQ